MTWLPRWYWGGEGARLRSPQPETRFELAFYGLHWGLLTIGKWKIEPVTDDQTQPK